MTEREERLDALAIEPAIADVNAFGIARAAADASRRRFRMRRVRRRSVFETPWPRERETAGGACLAREQIRRGPAAFIARVPHLENGANASQPRHGDGLPRIEHDDRV